HPNGHERGASMVLGCCHPLSLCEGRMAKLRGAREGNIRRRTRAPSLRQCARLYDASCYETKGGTLTLRLLRRHIRRRTPPPGRGKPAGKKPTPHWVCNPPPILARRSQRGRPAAPNVSASKRCCSPAERAGPTDPAPPTRRPRSLGKPFQTAPIVA